MVICYYCDNLIDRKLHDYFSFNEEYCCENCYTKFSELGVLSLEN